MQISKIILWPIDTKFSQKTVNFHLSKVNYIVGNSGTGKSSIWPIIDYCLGSSELRVPLGVVRDKVNWFGVLFVKDNKEKVLIARKNNVIGGNRSEWYFVKGEVVDIPSNIIKGNSTRDKIRDFLSSDFNFYLSHVNHVFFRELEKDKLGSISYRDLLSLNHQAQYALVNPSSLFIKDVEDISTTKLKKILPNILFGSIDENERSLRGRLKSITEQELVLKQSVFFLKSRLDTLYKEAWTLGMFKKYFDYVDYREHWPTERYINEIKRIVKAYLLGIENPSEDSHILDENVLQKCILIGRMSECLEFSVAIDWMKELNVDNELIKRNLVLLQTKFKSLKLDHPINIISRLIHIYAIEMKLEFLEFTPYFDHLDSTLKFRHNDVNDISLSKFGNTQNFIGYNIASFLAFHEILRMNNYNFVYPFIIIDQPSQGFLDNEANDVVKLNSLFSSLNIAITRMNSNLQIIVLERVIPKNLKNLSNSEVVEIWNKSLNQALIPEHW